MVMGIENVGYWHQAHSFVRGNWRNSNTTSPMILQKCCHDMDLLLWLTGKTAKSVSSYGSTMSFTMSGFTEKNSRFTKFMGTKGEILADFSEDTIQIQEFGEKSEIIDVSELSEDFSGHAGGDNRMVEEFLDMLLDRKESEKSMTTLERSLESHYIALAIVLLIYLLLG